MKRLAALLFPLSLLACSSEPPASLPDGGGSTDRGLSADTGQLAADAGPDADAAATDLGTSDSGNGPSDSGLVDAGTSTSGQDRRIDPIVVGRSWTYDVNVLGVYPLCENGTHTASATMALRLDGKDAIRVRSLCANAGSFDYSVDGDRVYAYVLGAWRLSLDAPVAEGHTWTDGVLSYRWVDTGTVSVPAGDFDECWSLVTQAAYDSHTVFCRGVGPVHWHYEDGFGNGYDAVLTAKNF